MAISYKKLWKLMIDKEISAVELREKTGIAPNTMTKLRRDEEVSMTVLVKICTALNANIGDMLHNVSIGNDMAIPKASNKDQKDMGYINTTDSKHHTFIKACKNDA